MHDNILPLCHRCGQSPPNGLYDGFRLRGFLICRNCEQEMLECKVGTPPYDEFRQLFKGILFNKGERIEGTS